MPACQARSGTPLAVESTALAQAHGDAQIDVAARAPANHQGLPLRRPAEVPDPVMSMLIQQRAPTDRSRALSAVSPCEVRVGYASLKNDGNRYRESVISTVEVARLEVCIQTETAQCVLGRGS